MISIFCKIFIRTINIKSGDEFTLILPDGFYHNLQISSLLSTSYGYTISVSWNPATLPSFTPSDDPEKNVLILQDKPYVGTEILGNYSHSEGRYNVASGVNSHVEGNNNQAINASTHTEGQYNLAKGEASHAEGTSTIADGNYSHTEGSGTKAYKPASHAEGGSTIAGEVPNNINADIVYPETEIDPDNYVPETGGGSSGSGEEGSSVEKDWGAHAEGLNTRALAMAAHSEGEMTKANKYASHAEGIGTIANTLGQHVEGIYNKIDENQDYLHIVGNGKNDKKRSNAHTLDWDGNAWYKGYVEAEYIILKSSNSSARFKITIDDAGVLTSTRIE